METKNIPVIGLEKYAITSDGYLLNKQKQLFRKATIHKTGYIIYTFGGKNKQKAYKAHKLVALTYIPNPFNYKSLNHINGIKTDNRVENLEWCTVSENNFHAYKLGLKTKSMSVFKKGNKAHKHIACNVTKGKSVGVFESFMEAGRANGINGSYLNRLARGIITSQKFAVNIVDRINE